MRKRVSTVSSRISGKVPQDCSISGLECLSSEGNERGIFSKRADQWSAAQVVPFLSC